MGVTVRDILETRNLALKLVAGAAGRANRIRWVHVSELQDPTPWLKGGELLLTTGMTLAPDPEAQHAYVERLVAAGLAGLGFGTGFSHDRVPSEVARTAERHRFPVFEVPYAIPFIAITEAVYSRVAAGQYETLERSVRAQTALTRVVVEGGGVTGLITALASAMGGWALVLDTHGVPLAAAPAAARGRAKALFEEARKGAQHGLRFGASLVAQGSHIAILPVGARGHVEGFLAVGRSEPLSEVDHSIAGHAVHLLAIELDKSRAVADAERRLKGDLLDALIEGGLGVGDAAARLRRFGFDPGAQVAVVAAAVPVAPPVTTELVWALEEHFAPLGRSYLLSPHEDAVLVLVDPAVLDLEALRRRLRERLGTEAMVAASRPAPSMEVAGCVREARYGLQVCRMEGRGTVTYDSLGTYRLLLGLQEPETMRAFSESVLGPLDAYDERHAGQLLTTLDSFLTNVGKWEATAAALGVHRHTLRYRIQKVEELTGRSLSLATDRTELWLALRARELVGATSAG